MKLAIIGFAALLSGCAYSRQIATLVSPDGSTNRIYYVGVGGVIRPGMGIIFTETTGTNPPVMLMQAAGAPIAPSITGAAGNIASAATLGSLWPDQSDNHSSSTTIIANPPPAGPQPPQPRVRPPWGPPARSPNHQR